MTEKRGREWGEYKRKKEDGEEQCSKKIKLRISDIRQLLIECPFKPGVGKLRPADCFFVAHQELVSSKNNSPIILVSNRLIPYKCIISMQSVTILRMDYVLKRFKHIFHFYWVTI